MLIPFNHDIGLRAHDGIKRLRVRLMTSAQLRCTRAWRTAASHQMSASRITAQQPSPRRGIMTSVRGGGEQGGGVALPAPLPTYLPPPLWCSQKLLSSLQIQRSMVTTQAYGLLFPLIVRPAAWYEHVSQYLMEGTKDGSWIKDLHYPTIYRCIETWVHPTSTRPLLESK